MTFQPSLDFPVHFSKDAYSYGDRPDGGTHGVVLTKPHVVELILDLAGYTSDLDLTTKSLLEPSCGHGAFIVAAARRLLDSARLHKRQIGELDSALMAFDIDAMYVDKTREALVQTLVDAGADVRTAERLARRWVQSADYLLQPVTRLFDFVVGNPPYIRIEQLAPELQVEYRRRYSTIFDRADLYVAFIERSLRLLSPQGVLSFVCADRWTLNRYGARLRALVSADFEMRTYVDLHKASPFEEEVVAYPSIFVIAREKRGKPVRVVTLTSAGPDECIAARDQRSGRKKKHPGVREEEYGTWFTGSDPWVRSSPEHLSVLRELEARLPLLEDGGQTSVRIGVASGNDSVYIVAADADIEPDRLVPLVMREDIEHGVVRDAKRCVINTFETKGTVNLANYPRLERYFSKHETLIKRRHVSRKNEHGWFRTIDRVYPALVSKPKLLIPDIAGANEVVYESGNYYPHHNLYFVTSDVWDLEVLGGLLSSRVALFFVWSYAVKMRGGYLRFQAQYLRRIRVPAPQSIRPVLQRQLKAAFRKRDFAKLDQLACVAYGLHKIPAFDFVDTRV
jgi:adenine-specific DNA-methyltransferase